MSRPRRPILTPQTYRGVVGIKGNEFVLKNTFVGVSNDLYVFLVVMKLRLEVSNALPNHLSLRVVIEEYCIWSRMALVVNHSWLDLGWVISFKDIEWSAEAVKVESKKFPRLLLEGFTQIIEGFPRSGERFPRSEEGFPLEVSAWPSDVSLGERSWRLLIPGSTRDDWDGTTLPCVSIMVCPLKELDTSALSASPWRLTEGVLEDEGPTLVDAGVSSCLLFNTVPVFRRLRDDLFDGKILGGMIRLGGIELQKGAPWEISGLSWGFRGADSKLKLYGRKAEGQLEQSDNSSTASLSKQWGFRGADSKLELYGRKAEG